MTLNLLCSALLLCSMLLNARVHGTYLLCSVVLLHLLNVRLMMMLLSASSVKPRCTVLFSAVLLWSLAHQSRRGVCKNTAVIRLCQPQTYCTRYLSMLTVATADVNATKHNCVHPSQH